MYSLWLFFSTKTHFTNTIRCFFCIMTLLLHLSAQLCDSVQMHWHWLGVTSDLSLTALYGAGLWNQVQVCWWCTVLVPRSQIKLIISTTKPSDIWLWNPTFVCLQVHQRFVILCCEIRLMSVCNKALWCLQQSFVTLCCEVRLCLSVTKLYDVCNKALWHCVVKSDYVCL